jgi:upstream activation factor subunit UAF30
MILSPALSALFGGETTVSDGRRYVMDMLTVQLSRPQAVKRLWEHIRANELQDPSDRRQIRCDDAMRAVFKQDKVHMFQMTKILNHNLYNPEE